jgi:hypothetical protein
MPEEATNTTVNTVKETSDGFVKISVEKYNDLLEKVADQNGRIGTLREQLNEARSKPPVINRTVINKTAEMVAEEHRVWGYTFMGTGAVLFGIGAYRYKAGRS